jgi:hypothetical protein
MGSDRDRLSQGADDLRDRMAGKLIAGKVKRFPFYRVPSAW